MGRGVGSGLPHDQRDGANPRSAIRGGMRPTAYSPRETRAKKKERLEAEYQQEELYQILTDIARDRFVHDTESEYSGVNHDQPLESQHSPNAISGYGPPEEIITTHLVGSDMNTIDLELAGDTVNYSQPGTEVETNFSHGPPISTAPHGSWTAVRVGLRVLTTGEKLGRTVAHGLPHEIFEGTVIAEWVEGASGIPMLLAKFPREEGPTQLRVSDCRLENIDQEVHLEVGESSRCPAHNLAQRGFFFPAATIDNIAKDHTIPGEGVGSQDGRRGAPPTIHPRARVGVPPSASDKVKGKKTAPNSLHARVIPDYKQVHEGSTQESTAAKKTPFPQVEATFPPYLGHVVCSGVSGEDWSSGSEWLGSLGGESNDNDTDESGDWEIEDSANQDRFFPTDGNDVSFEEWAETPESFRNVALTGPQFDAFYHESNWGSDHVTLLGSRDTFCGPQPGAKTIVTCSLPTPENLFQLYWPDTVVDVIVQETNRYATQVLPPKCRNQDPSNLGSPVLPTDVESRTRGGKTWKSLDAVEFRAWLGITIYMGIVKLPNQRMYWTQKHDILQYSYIARVMSCKRWESITRYLHLVDNSLLARIPRPEGASSLSVAPTASVEHLGMPTRRGKKEPNIELSRPYRKGKKPFEFEGEYCSLTDSGSDEDATGDESPEVDDWQFPFQETQGQEISDIQTLPVVDKLAKSRWIIDWFNTRSQELYNVEPFVTVDELIIPYKGQYCTIRQYLPAKPVRFGIKLWGLASSKSRFVSLVSVYMGKGTGQGEFGLGHQVVMGLVTGLERRWHTVVTDNFFSSTRLAHELMRRGFWFCGTIKPNSKGLPHALKRAKSQTRKGSILIKMHRVRQIVALSWQDKEMVTFLSTGADAWQPGIEVERRQRRQARKATIPSTPVHLMYQEYMRGVDVTNQLRTNYSCLLSTHKWWHKFFFYVVDQSIINCYILHCEESQRLGLPVLNHMYFNMGVGDYLVAPYLQAIPVPSIQPYQGSRHPHGPQKGSLRRYCVACGSKQRGFCAGCDYRWMCPLSCYNFCHLPENLGKMPRKGSKGHRLY